MKLQPFFLLEDGRVRSIWRAFLFVPLFLVLALGFGISIAFLVGTIVGGSQWSKILELRLLVAAPAELAAALLAAWLLLRWFDSRSFQTLGLWLYKSWGRELGLGLLFGLGLNSAVVLLTVAVGLIHFHGFTSGVSAALGGAAWNLVLLLPAAAAEEAIFRGYPFQRLVESWGPFWAVFFLAALFGGAHLRNTGVTPLSTANTALMGVLLAVAYLRTRGLWLPIGLHLTWNFAMGYLYGLPVSGFLLSHRLLVAESHGPEWISGGNYGPEASVLCTGVVLAATLWLARTRRLGVSPVQAKVLESSYEAGM